MWGDPWLDNNCSFFIESALVPTFEDMVIKNFYITGTKDWDQPLIQEVFPEIDCEPILKTTPSPQGVADKEVWHFSSNGLCTVKSAYHLAMRVIHDSWEIHDSPRKLKVPPRVKNFYWRLCKGWIDVRAKIGRWYYALYVRR